MTPSKAALHLAKRLEGEIKSPKERKAEEEAARLAEEGRWTLDQIFDRDMESGSFKGAKTDRSRYRLHLQPDFGSLTPEEISKRDVENLRPRL